MKHEFKWIDPRYCIHHPVYLPKAFKYAKAMESGAKFPPVRVHLNLDTGQFEVSNGAHRAVAAKLCGQKLLVRVSRFQHRQLLLIED